MKSKFPKIQSIVQLYELLPENERIITDMLRQIVSQYLSNDIREKISFNVPYLFGKKGICIIWPATVPGGGIKKGVLFGFWYGNRLNDEDNYLSRGTNKQVFYRIYNSPEEIDEVPILKLLKEAVRIDLLFETKK